MVRILGLILLVACLLIFGRPGPLLASGINGEYTGTVIINNNVCGSRYPVQIQLSVKGDNVSGNISSEGLKCAKYHTGDIEGWISPYGEFQNIKIKQKHPQGRTYGSYKITGTLKSATLVSINKHWNPPAKFKFIKIKVGSASVEQKSQEETPNNTETENAVAWVADSSNCGRSRQKLKNIIVRANGDFALTMYNTNGSWEGAVEGNFKTGDARSTRVTNAGKLRRIWTKAIDKGWKIKLFWGWPGGWQCEVPFTLTSVSKSQHGLSEDSADAQEPSEEEQEAERQRLAEEAEIRREKEEAKRRLAEEEERERLAEEAEIRGEKEEAKRRLTAQQEIIIHEARQVIPNVEAFAKTAPKGIDFLRLLELYHNAKPILEELWSDKLRDDYLALRKFVLNDPEYMAFEEARRAKEAEAEAEKQRLAEEARKQRIAGLQAEVGSSVAFLENFVVENFSSPHAVEAMSLLGSLKDIQPLQSEEILQQGLSDFAAFVDKTTAPAKEEPAAEPAPEAADMVAAEEVKPKKKKKKERKKKKKKKKKKKSGGFGLDSLTGGGDDGVSLVDQQSEVVDTLTSALSHLNEAQAIMAEALGLKEEAVLTDEVAEKLDSGDLSGESDMEYAVSKTVEMQEAINEKMNEGIKLDAESKAVFATSLPPYGIGSLEMVLTGKEAVEAATSIAKTKDFTILAKIGTLIYIVEQAPDLISLFTDATSSILRFSEENDIDTEELEAVEDEMGD